MSACDQPFSAVQPRAVTSNAKVHWFAVHTQPNFEKRVAQYFFVRQIEHYLPLYHTVHRWRNRCTVPLDLPLFPRYVFVRIEPAERVRVIQIPRVLGIVSSGREPLPLPDFEIDALRAGLHLRLVEPSPFLVVGERARIRCGPLAGLEGIVLRKKNCLRVVITVEVIMQSVAVEVDACDLEPMGKLPPRACVHSSLAGASA